MNFGKPALICLAILLVLPLRAGTPNDWAKAFSGSKVKKTEYNNFEIYFFPTCTVPDDSKTEPVSDPLLDAFEKEAAPTDPASLKDKLEQYKETREYYEAMAKGAEEKLKALGEASFSLEKQSLEEDLKVAQSMLKEVEKDILAIEEQLSPKDSKKKPAKDGGGKAGAVKKESPKAKPTREEQTDSYYYIGELTTGGDRALSQVNKILGTELNWSKPKTKVYFVTSPKMWQALKTKEKLFQPARNVCWDSKQRAILLFASPAIKSKLSDSFAYAVASMAMELGMKIINPEGELSNFIQDGLAVYASELNDVVDVNKVHNFGILKNKELLLVAELLNPTRMKDNKRCYYFLVQSSAFAKYMANRQLRALREYLRQAKGGNSGFRNSFQFLEVSKYWGQDYDSFCEDLPHRIFFPLTEESEKDPNALAQWESDLKDRDREQDEKKRLMEERKQTRQQRRDYGDEFWRKHLKKK